MIRSLRNWLGMIALFCGVVLLLSACKLEDSSSSENAGNCQGAVICDVHDLTINAGGTGSPLIIGREINIEPSQSPHDVAKAFGKLWEGAGQPSDAQYPKWWYKKKTKPGKKYYGYGYGKTRALAAMAARIEIVNVLGVEISTYTGCLEAWISEYSRSEEAALRRNSDSVKECYENNETGSAGHLKGSWVEKSEQSGLWTFVRVLHEPKR